MNRELVFSLFTSRRMDSNSWRSVARSRTDASVLGGRGTKACELDGDCAGVMKCGITRVVGKSSWCKFNGNQQRADGSSAACSNDVLDLQTTATARENWDTSVGKQSTAGKCAPNIYAPQTHSLISRHWGVVAVWFIVSQHTGRTGLLLIKLLSRSKTCL